MRQGWRWFGPNDPVTHDHIRQAGATDVVSSLHHLPIGTAWTRKDVAAHKALIETTPAGRTPLVWSVIESIPIPDDVKRTGGKATQSIDAWIASMEAAAAEGVRTICYNFMPVVDWTRTDLDHVMPTGATAMRFDNDRFAAFELFILKRPGAEKDFPEDVKARAKAAYDNFTQADIDYLIMVIASALPGSTTEPMTIDGFREKLKQYAAIDADVLRRHLIEFLGKVAPVAEQLGVKLTIHPDDPPRPLFGLPRVASKESDFKALFDAVPTPANGLCFCTGSLGVRAENDLPGMAARFAERIYFTHLRATKREADGMSFHESDHLDGDVDMVAVLRALLAEDHKRPEGEKIILRPDHGHRMLDDLDATKVVPGYTAIGRLKGLGELRGIIRALGSR